MHWLLTWNSSGSATKGAFKLLTKLPTNQAVFLDSTGASERIVVRVPYLFRPARDGIDDVLYWQSDVSDSGLFNEHFQRSSSACCFSSPQKLVVTAATRQELEQSGISWYIAMAQH
jgi:hypothetical protein